MVVLTASVKYQNQKHGELVAFYSNFQLVYIHGHLKTYENHVDYAIK